MANLSIDNATADDAIGGSEFFPASDSGNPKKISVDQIKDFVIQALLDATDASAQERPGSKFMVRASNGSLRRIALDDILAAAESAIFGESAATTLSNAAVVPVKDGANAKTITYAKLVELLSSAISTTATVNISSLNSASTLADANLVLLDQSGNVKVTLGNLKSFFLAGLAAYMGSLSEGAASSTSEIIIRNGTTAYRVALSGLASTFGDVRGPETRTENAIPQWDGSGKLKTGLAVTSGTLTTDGTAIPTEGAVKAALTALESSFTAALSASTVVRLPSGAVAGNIPAYGSGNELASGYSVQSTVRASGTASASALATEAAIRAALDTAVSGLQNAQQVAALISTALAATNFITEPLAPIAGYLPVFLASGDLDNGYSVQTSVRSDGNALDTAIPTEKAVRDVLVAMQVQINGKASAGHTHANATTEAAGFMSAADKTKLNRLENDADLDDFTSTIADADKITMTDQSVGTNFRLSFGQIWNWIAGKLAATPLTTFTVGADVTTANATTSAPGLLPKLDGSSARFLAGDGTWQAPAGSEVFGGDEGTGGTSGLVPAPAAGEAGFVLMGDGSWGQPPIQTGSEHVSIHDQTAASGALDADELLVYQSGSFKKLTAEQLAAYVNATPRYDVLWVPGGAITPNATYGAVAEVLSRTASNLISVDTIRFSAQENTFADFDVVFPDDWDGGEIKVKIHWTPYTSATAAGQVVRFGLRAKFFDNNVPITGLSGSYSYVDDLVLAYDNEHITDVLTITPNGSYVPGQRVHFWMMRDFDYTDGVSDAMATAASVLGVAIQYRRAGGTEAWT